MEKFTSVEIGKLKVFLKITFTFKKNEEDKFCKK